MTLGGKRTVIVAAGAAAFLVFAGCAALLLNMQAFKPRIEAAASDALGIEVRIRGSVGIALFPWLGVSLKDVSVRHNGADVWTVEKIRIGLRPASLSERKVLIDRIGLIRPVLAVIRYRNGTFLFEDQFRTMTERPFSAKRISIQHGKFFYSDERSGARVEADGVDAEIRNVTYGGPAGAGSSESVAFTGDIKCGTLSYEDFLLTDLEMKAAMRGGKLDITPFSMRLFGGDGKGSVHADLTASAPAYHATLELGRFRVEKLIRAYSSANDPRKSLWGTADFSADLKASGNGLRELKRSLNGVFSLNGGNLVLRGVDIEALIPKYRRSQNFSLFDVGAFFLVGPLGPVITKSYNFGSLYLESRGGTGSIKKLVSIWNVKNGIAGATDVAFASKKYRVAMKGGLDFNNDRFLDVTVAVLNKRGCASYSQKVHGPFTAPRIDRVGILKSITGSVSNAVGDAFSLVHNCAIFYSGSVAPPGN